MPELNFSHKLFLAPHDAAAGKYFPSRARNDTRVPLSMSYGRARPFSFDLPLLTVVLAVRLSPGRLRALGDRIGDGYTSLISATFSDPVTVVVWAVHSQAFNRHSIRKYTTVPTSSLTEVSLPIHVRGEGVRSLRSNSSVDVRVLLPQCYL